MLSFALLATTAYQPLPLAAVHNRHVSRRSCSMALSDADKAQAKLMESLMRLRESGMSDEQILEEVAQEEREGTVLPTSALAIPTSGMQPWGRWSQSQEGMYIEICVEKGTTGKSVTCEVQRTSDSDGENYHLHVRGMGDTSLLSGRLAQACHSEPDWALDEHAVIEGSGLEMKVLCIELRKRETPRSPVDAASFEAREALFSSLRVYDEEFSAPGLVSGK